MLDQFSRQNRWWTTPSAIYDDRHLSRVSRSTIPWLPPLPFQFNRDAIYTLRGPRQVGKSTILKRQIKQLIVEGWQPSGILYLDVELAGLERGSDLVSALRSYLDRERARPGQSQPRLALFLDEVTRVDNWAGALRGLVDNDELRNVTVVATGSHTRDLASGGERLPGRRGGSPLDWELLPLSFREYVRLLSPELSLPSVLPDLSPEAARARWREVGILHPRLSALFDQYLTVGGFLPAINDYAGCGAVTADTYQTYREAIAGEFTRAGLRESFLREVIGWVAGHLGQEFDYRDVAADTDIGSKDTARNYLDNLETSYVAFVCYRTPSLLDPSPAFRAPKKLHPIDPLLWHLVSSWAAADPDPWAAVVASLGNPEMVGRLVETAIVVHARRAFGKRVHYWRPDNRREIDLVVAPVGAPVGFVESKYQQTVVEHDARVLANAGGGLVATRHWEGDMAGGSVYAMPASCLLALLDTPSLAPHQS